MAKKAELILTQAWQNNSPILRLLAPLSCIYGVVTYIRKQCYQIGLCASYRAPVPVLVIGNITVGGSGKTPLIIALVKILMARGIQVGVISRGYGVDSGKNSGSNSLVMSRLVLEDSLPEEVGDEPCLISQALSADGYTLPMAIGANRAKSIKLLLQTFPKTALIISDDGLQHYALHRDEEWIVVDKMRGFGNAKLLPQGFLREPVSRLIGATVIYHHQTLGHCPKEQMAMALQAGEIEPLLTDNPRLIPHQTRVYAVSGIGYPKRFFDTLACLGFDVVPYPFGDHHRFTLADLQSLTDLPIITTAKDAVKLRVLANKTPDKIFDNIWVLPVQAKLSCALIEALNQLIDKYQL